MPRTEACHCRRVRPILNCPNNKRSEIGSELAPKFKFVTVEAVISMKTKETLTICPQKRRTFAAIEAQLSDILC